MPVSFVFLVLVTFAIDAILMQFYDESLLSSRHGDYSPCPSTEPYVRY